MTHNKEGPDEMARFTLRYWSLLGENPAVAQLQIQHTQENRRRDCKPRISTFWIPLVDFIKCKMKISEYILSSII